MNLARKAARAQIKELIDQAGLSPTDNPEVFHVYLGLCSHDKWEGMFGFSFIEMICRLFTHGICGRALDGISFGFHGACSHLTRSKQEMIEEAIARGCTHFVNFDDDTTFPPDSLDYLFKHKLPFVGVNMRKKFELMDPFASDMDQKKIDSTGKTGIQEVYGTGQNLFLIELSAMEGIPKPWFRTSSEETTDDIVFMNLLRAHGHKVYIDHDLSNKVGHLGKKLFTFGNWGLTYGN